MKYVLHHDLDGLDEATMPDHDEIELSLIGRRPVVKPRPDRNPSASRTKVRRQPRDREDLLRRARVKAWGMPY